MLDLTIDLVLWKATESDADLAKKIGSSVIAQLPEEINIRILNVSAIEYSEPTTKHSIIIAFGDLARGMLPQNKEIYLVPEISRLYFHPKNAEYRKSTLEITKNISTRIKEMYSEESIENKQIEYIETDKGIKIGKSGLDINITEQEAEYLKKIRNLLGGGKMVITKGNLKIEVEMEK